MKNYMNILMVIMTVGLFGCLVFAEEENEGRKSRKGRHFRGRREYCMERLGLTEEQKAAIQGIRRMARETARDAETHEERDDIIRRMHSAVNEVLTAQQIEELEECKQRNSRRGDPHRYSRGPHYCFKGLDLTDQQSDGIKEIRRKARRAAREAETSEERHGIMKRAHEAVKDVLTEQQRQELEECRRISGRRGRPGHHRRNLHYCVRELDLTDQQRKQIKEIRQEARRTAKEDETSEERHGIMKRAHEAIKDVLTEQQIKELQECKKMSGPQGDRHHYRRGPRRCLRELDLTDRQRNQIREIHQTAGQQAAGKAESGEESRDIMKKAHKAVRDILTESQLEELENCVRESALPEDPPCRSRRGGRRLQRESSW